MRKWRAVGGRRKRRSAVNDSEAEAGGHAASSPSPPSLAGPLPHGKKDVHALMRKWKHQRAVANLHNWQVNLVFFQSCLFFNKYQKRVPFITLVSANATDTFLFRSCPIRVQSLACISRKTSARLPRFSHDECCLKRHQSCAFVLPLI